MLGLILLVTSALADGLALDWNQPLRYRSEVQVLTPNGYLYKGRANVEARVTSHELAVDLSCTGAPQGASTAVICAVDAVQLGAKAYPGDEADTVLVLEEYRQWFAGSTWQIRFAADGRVMDVDLEGVEKNDDRMAEIHETLRQLARRVVTPLDLSMPKKAVGVGASWKQKGTPLLFQLMTTWGTAGGTVMRHRLEAQQGAVAQIGSEGRGNVATGLDLEVGSGETVNMIGGGVARVDTARSLILWRQVGVSGELTASSLQPGDPAVYSLMGWAGLRNPDGTVETESGPRAWPPQGSPGPR